MMRRCGHCKKRHVCSPAGKKASAARKSEKRAQHQDSTASIREAVFQRAGTSCECDCGRTFSDEYFSQSAELDHWVSGSGRRREQQSVENTWALTWICHNYRTHNEPSAAFWNEKFKAHCERYGYPFTPHIVHEPLTRKA